MNNNPLSKYFRQAGAYVRLPTLGIWYTDGSVNLNDEGEIPIYPLSAIDDILLNTPDAMLNGQALEKVIKNCAPDVKDIKKLLIPDLETIFVGMKAASNNGKFDLDRKCPKCEYENTYEVNCNGLLATSTIINENDRKITFNGELEVWVKPYTFEMRQLFIKREFAEEKLLRSIDESNKQIDELEKAKILAESVDRISNITFDLVSKSIEKIVLLQTNETITDKNHINEWLTNISKKEADIVIETVNKLNSVGPNKEFPAQCTKCEHTWTETLNFDPSSFFGKSS
jgi:hypothetical protein